ncbi:MAG: mechanosensitive ion channel [Bacteroidetes bacterium]|nr:mechanosensitive ion channel [Bacteroidota bacterium]
MGENLSGFAQFFKDTLFSYANSMAAAFKTFVGALVILIIGWIIAKIVSKTIRKLLERIQVGKLLEKSNLQELFGNRDMAKTATNVISKFVYYFILLIFILMATEALGMEAITEQVSALIDFFPKVVIAVIIFMIGFYIASFIRDMVTTATKSVGIAGGSIIGSGIFYFLLIIVSVTSIEQMGIDTELITSNLSIIIAGIIIGGAISYGFAAKDIMSDIVSTFFAKKSFIAGQFIRIGDIEGQIIEINSTNITVLSNNDKIVVPTKQFMSQSVTILNDVNNERNE